MIPHLSGCLGPQYLEVRGDIRGAKRLRRFNIDSGIRGQNTGAGQQFQYFALAPKPIGWVHEHDIPTVTQSATGQTRQCVTSYDAGIRAQFIQYGFKLAYYSPLAIDETNLVSTTRECLNCQYAGAGKQIQATCTAN